MKKTAYCSVITFLLLLILSTCNNQDNTNLDAHPFTDDVKVSESQHEADYHVPSNFDDLKERAEIIVKVKTIQDLGDDAIEGEVLGSKKAVEVLNSYKGDLEIGKRIIIMEPAFVRDGEYVQTDAYVKMENDELYILFLKQGDNENEYGVVSLGFGKYSEEKQAYHGELSEFSTFEDLKKYDFISNLDEMTALYEKIKEDVLKEFN